MAGGVALLAASDAPVAVGMQDLDKHGGEQETMQLQNNATNRQASGAVTIRLDSSQVHSFGGPWLSELAVLKTCGELSCG